MAVALMFAFNLIWFQAACDATSFVSPRTHRWIWNVGGTILGSVFLVWFRTKSAWLIEILNRLFTRWRFVPQRSDETDHSDSRTVVAGVAGLVNVSELAETIGWTVLVWFGIAFANFLVMRAFRSATLASRKHLCARVVVGRIACANTWRRRRRISRSNGSWLLFLGVEKETGGRVSIILHLVDFGPAVLFGVFYFIRGDLTFRD